MTTEILVRGAHVERRAPERGMVRVRLSADGPELEAAHQRVVEALDHVAASVRDLLDPAGGVVVAWSTTHLSTWSERPWSQTGEQLPLVHHAAVEASATFADLDAIADWLAQHVGRTATFDVAGITWSLTDSTRQELERRVRTAAVHDAARRAQEYADALGLGRVRAVTIADVGLLHAGAGGPGGPGAPYLEMAMAKDAGGGQPDLAPEDIEVAVQVEARFTAGRPDGAG